MASQLNLENLICRKQSFHLSTLSSVCNSLKTQGLIQCVCVFCVLKCYWESRNSLAQFCLFFNGIPFFFISFLNGTEEDSFQAVVGPVCNRWKLTGPEITSRVVGDVWLLVRLTQTHICTWTTSEQLQVLSLFMLVLYWVRIKKKMKFKPHSFNK